MRQEDYNDMMKTPEESLQLRQSNISKKLPECPICKSEYLGDGVAPCVECDNKYGSYEPDGQSKAIYWSRKHE